MTARLSFAPPPPITPEMRVSQRAHARTFLTWSYAGRFPLSAAVHLLHGYGLLPLEGVRWVNGNRHKPKHFWHYTVQRHPWYPPTLIDAAWVKLFRAQPKNFEVKGIDSLRALVASMRPEKVKIEGLAPRRRLGKYWIDDYGDTIFNRDITPPGKKAAYLEGVVGVRFDEDFFFCAALPYCYRELTIEQIISVIYPHLEPQDCEFLPDSGSPEMEAYFAERAKALECSRA